MKRTKTKLFLIGSFLLCILIAACSKADKNELFQQKLNSIDSTIENGNTQKALKSLSALRKKARFPVQYLSIAKRELQLHSPVQALQSMQAGLKKHPDDPMLKAALTDTLLQEDRIEDAAAIAEALLGTSYAGIGTEALIQADKIKQTYRTPVPFWQEGFRLTGEHIFLENAAAVLAHQGEIAEAAALRSRIAKDEALRSPYFWSCLAYDMGNFQPVLDDLVYSLAYADMAGLPEHNPKAFEYARRHLLLAADASAGLGDMDQARGFWQMYVDRYADSSSEVFYNLAMTAPTQEEKAEVLIDCISQNPGYYPAVAQYVRACSAIEAAHSQKNPLDEYLQSKDFYSLEMEKSLFVSSAFTLSAEEVLESAMNADKDDIRFELEEFRYRYVQPKNYTRGNGEMWKILEAHPHNPLVKAYARWYFASSGDFNACFGIDKADNHYEDAFYDGIRRAVQGYSTAALKNFAEAEAESRYRIPSAVDQAYIYDARNEPDMAIKFFSRAAELVPDKRTKSKMLYESARIYAERNGIAEAIALLNQSLKLDSENHRANVLRQKLIADGSVNRNAGLDTFLRIEMNPDTNTGMEAGQNSTAINPR
ncbi:tetratricopeptide repeat protein [Treponema vincentii]|uniref:tetratricopeptide repeat protein n=1 Tax=Treponema vincentii TaxID=69710 RepID=UPI0005872848|nr:lipoprotein [Treponema vincentii]